MKMRHVLIMVLSSVLFLGNAQAEVHEVKMLNRGETGSMVFEPDYLAIQPGDSVKFIATHKSHNAASIIELMPENTPAFKGKINEELEVKFDTNGFYGIQCTPHFSMGMIMVIKVGDDEVLPNAFRTYKAPGKSHERLQNIITNHNL
ncbi:pseudoazurin [Wohlfahrtiimonas chitiniclastica]|uniref:pseudoazurin n=1 Tax=Wohlfahrtiimonas chitiniclastica TaxID=400946 RepID=UPI003CCFEA2A